MKLIPTWIWLAIIAALAALVGVEHLRANHHKTNFAEFRVQVAQANERAEREARDEENRRKAVADEEAQNARDETQALQSDVVRLADVADGLRDAVAEWKRRAAARSCPTVGIKGQPSPEAAPVLPELYLELVEHARASSQFADGLDIAGTSCENTADKMRR